MSNHIMDRIWWREDFDDLIAPIQGELPGSGRSLKWVLVALADNASDEGFCWPSVETIAQKTSLATRSVQRAIKQAIRLGIIRRRLRKGNSSQYVFNLDVLPQGRPGKAGRASLFETFENEPDLFEEASDEGVTSVQEADFEGGDIYAGGVTSVQKRGATLSPKPSIEPPIEPPLESVAEKSSTAIAIRELSLSDFVKAEWKALREELGDNISDCRSITSSQEKLLHERATQHAENGESKIDVWRVVFSEIRKSRFLQGRAPPGPGRAHSFRLSLSHLLKPHIFREVINGKYADKTADAGNYDATTGQVLGPAAKAARNTVERIQLARERFGGS